MNNSKAEGVIRCFIIDDEADMRERLKNLLLKIDNIDVIGSDEASDESIRIISDSGPDIVFIDVEMPRFNGFDVIERIRSNNCYPTFVFITGFNQYAIKAIKNAAFDYLLKPVDIEELNQTIIRFRDSLSMTKNICNNIPGYDLLTKREEEVLELMLGGHTSREIAEKLFISKNTVDTHRRNILKKIDITSTVDLFRLL